MAVLGRYNAVGVNIVGIVFVKSENGPATCSAWLGTREVYLVMLSESHA